MIVAIICAICLIGFFVVAIYFEQLLYIIFLVSWVGLFIVFPIIYAIKKSINEAKEGKVWNVKVFLEYMFLAFCPFLILALFYGSFYLFEMLFANQILAGITAAIITSCVCYIVFKEK